MNRPATPPVTALPRPRENPVMSATAPIPMLITTTVRIFVFRVLTDLASRADACRAARRCSLGQKRFLR